jgi:protein-S-isoprenylcysteine O-methyltransferase Ste14
MKLQQKACLLPLLGCVPFGVNAFQIPSIAARYCTASTTIEFNQQQAKRNGPLFLSDNPMEELDKVFKAASASDVGKSSDPDESEAVDGSQSYASSPAVDAASSFSSMVEDPGALVAKAKGMFSNLNLDSSIFSIVKSNILDGSLGERGEAWTVGALSLVVSIVVGTLPVPYLSQIFTALGGPGLMVAGGALVLASLNDLGANNLTPFLSPVSSGSLVTDGIYSKIRHPIYSGLICLCAGFAILTESAPRLVLTAVLIFLLNVKSDKEEEKLIDKFPEYAAYRATTGKFYPGDWSFRESETN